MFIGNQKMVRLLERQIKSGKIAQAYLFCGPESVGKFTLAKKISGKIIGTDDYVLDLVIIEPEVEVSKSGVMKEKEIKIEKIKEAQKELSLFPYQGRYRILIVNNAHQMTESSQNALLKILEEPNKTSIIILVTHEENRVIPTIRSRCQKINFNLVPEEEIKSSLLKKGDRKEIASWAMGRPGAAVNLKDNIEEFESLKYVQEKFNSLSKTGINEKLALAEDFSRNIPETVKKMKFLLWILQEEAVKNTNSKRAIINLKKAEKISECLELLKNTGINSRLVLENLLLNI